MPINVKCRRQGELLSRSCSSSPTEKKRFTRCQNSKLLKEDLPNEEHNKDRRLYPKMLPDPYWNQSGFGFVSSNLPQCGSRSGSGNQLQIRLRDPAPGSGFSSGFAATMKEKIWHFFFHCFKFFKFFFISFYQLKVDFLLLKYTSHAKVQSISLKS